MTKIEQADELARLQEALDHANARYDFDVNQMKDQLDQVRRERNAAETELDELKAKPLLSWGATRSYMKDIWDQAGLSERTKLETKTSKHSWVAVFPTAFAEAQTATPLVRDMLHLLLYEVLRYQDHTTRLSESAIEAGRRLAGLRAGVRLWVYRTGAMGAGETRSFKTIADLLAFTVEQKHELILDGQRHSWEWIEDVHGPIDGTLEIYDGYRE